MFCTATQLPAQNLLERLERKLESVLKEKEPGQPEGARPENVTPGYLGLKGDDAGEMGRGVRVLEVYTNSPAELSGLKAGDLVVAVNGAAITRLDDLATQIERSVAGSKVDVKIERDGKSQIVPVTLGRKNEPAASPLPPPVASPRASAGIPFRPGDAGVPIVPEVAGHGQASLGITVTPVTDEMRALHRLTVRSGAFISGVQPGSPADQAGLPIGGVIVAAEGRRIENPDDLIALILSMKPGDELLLSYYREGTLLRKTVRLGEQPREIRVPVPSEPAGTDRPLLRRLEKALDPSGLRPGVPVAPEQDVAALQREIESLRTQVSALESRLQAVEKILKAEQPAGEPQLELNGAK
jgi:S1-C subfamily serine protease